LIGRETHGAAFLAVDRLVCAVAISERAIISAWKWHDLVNSNAMTRVTIELPDETFATLKRSPEEVGSEMRLASAIDWFRRGLISQGRAAEIAGVSRSQFLDALAARKIDVLQVDFEELKRESGRG
jgi:predicted HTH domain antitoxin